MEEWILSKELSFPGLSIDSVHLYQITNGIFHRTREEYFIICMETQNTQKSQINLEKERLVMRYNSCSIGHCILVSTICFNQYFLKKMMIMCFFFCQCDILILIFICLTVSDYGHGGWDFLYIFGFVLLLFLRIFASVLIKSNFFSNVFGFAIRVCLHKFNFGVFLHLWSFGIVENCRH